MTRFSTSAALARVRVAFGSTSAGPPPDDPPDIWRGSGPVVLVGGLCTTEHALQPLRHWLERLGYVTTVCTIGAGMGCGGRSVTRLGAVVRSVADTAGEEVRLLGYSRGGQFARVLAQDPVIPVRSLLTLGTPFDLYGVSRFLLLQAAGIALAGSLGAPGMASLSCAFGSCCSEFRGLLREPVPVPFTALYSRGDGLVRWQTCIDHAARLVEVPGDHLALLTDAAPLRAVAEELRHDHAAAHRPAGVVAAGH